MCKNQDSGTFCPNVGQYNFPNVKGGAYCREHAEEGMVSIAGAALCSFPDCLHYARYSYTGYRLTHCRKHALQGMVSYGKVNADKKKASKKRKIIRDILEEEKNRKTSERKNRKRDKTIRSVVRSRRE